MCTAIVSVTESEKRGDDDIRARRKRAPEVSVGAGCITVIELIMQQHAGPV